MTPRFWVFALILFALWFYYEKHIDIFNDTWNWAYERIQKLGWFLGITIVLYILFFQKGILGDIFKSISAIDNDPRLNRVSTLGFHINGHGGDHRMPGIRTKQKRNVSGLLKKKVAASQQWKCGSCNTVLDETYEVDHKVALEHGGTNDPSNLWALCPHCHRKKTVNERIFT